MQEENKPAEKVDDRARRRATRTRKRLLDSALAVFAETGVESCTVEQITERADVGKGTFYRHFEDKQAILTTLVGMAVTQLLEYIQPDQKEPSRNLPELTTHLVDAHVAFVQAHPEMFALLQIRLVSRLRQTPAPAPDDPILKYVGVLEKLLAPLVPPPVDPLSLRRMACMLAGFLSGFFLLARTGMRREDLPPAIASLRRAIAAGLHTMLAAGHA